MNKIESIGVVGGLVATTQSFSEAVLPSVFIIAIGVAIALIGRYR